MTTASRSLPRTSARPTDPRLGARRLSSARRVIGWLLVLVAALVFWEGAKWLGGDPWRIHATIAGVRIDYEHFPPLHWRIADDLSIPHVWDVVRAFVDPAQRNGPPLGLVLFGQSLFTLGEAAFGFAWGSMLGLGLAILFVHSRLAERSLAPYVIASQTVPILAIAPIVVAAIKADWLSVAFVTAYLSFFPVTIGALRGLRAADPRAHELLRSYAASPTAILWKLRLPTSVPYVFTALRVAAAGSIIGAIIGEQTAGVASGLGSAIINYNQYYIAGPEKLWATIVMTTLVGLVFVGLVVVVERVVTRGRYRPVEAR
jgi:NitT/TauT family transport system permease protein